MDSQLSKTRVLELLGKREQALTTLAACFRKLAPIFSSYHSLNCNHSARILIMNVCGAETCSYHKRLAPCRPRFLRWLVAREWKVGDNRQVREPGRRRGNQRHMGLK